MNIEALINLKTWESLPENLKKLLTQCMIENEKTFKPIMQDMSEKEYLEMQTETVSQTRTLGCANIRLYL